jgi:hypothetical protein
MLEVPQNIQTAKVQNCTKNQKRNNNYRAQNKAPKPQMNETPEQQNNRKRNRTAVISINKVTISYNENKIKNQKNQKY